MKKNRLFLLIAILLVGYPLFAQFGAQAGVAFSSAKEKYEGISMDFSTKTMFTGGLFYRKDFGGKFAFQPEINYLPKGGSYNETVQVEEGGEVDMEAEMSLNYLEIPLYVLYNGGKSSGFYAGLGPSFNVGLSGKVKASVPGESFEEDIEFGDDGDLKGFHMGINGIVGYQMQNGLTFNGFISQSITNSELEKEGDAKFSMFTFGIRAGYLFNVKNENAQSKLKTVF
jgi:hypothetical protein